jgi:hypothetical protein
VTGAKEAEPNFRMTDNLPLAYLRSTLRRYRGSKMSFIESSVSSGCTILATVTVAKFLHGKILTVAAGEAKPPMETTTGCGPGGTLAGIVKLTCDTATDPSRSPL